MSLLKKDSFGICHDVSHRLSYAVVLCFALLFSVLASPAAQPDGFNDRTDPNFVTASLLVMSPGDELYSCEEYIAGRKEWT